MSETLAYKMLCQQILQRDGYRCRNCDAREQLHIHHCLFRSHGGPDESWNLLTLCLSCHAGIHTAIRDGEPGLRIIQPEQKMFDANLPVQFLRAPWWFPGK